MSRAATAEETGVVVLVQKLQEERDSALCVLADVLGSTVLGDFPDGSVVSISAETLAEARRLLAD